MNIRKGDKVRIISGKDKGKTGSVLKVYPKLNRVIVEGVNIAKKHIKPGTVSKEGGIVSIERAINAGNAMIMDEKAGRPVRIGYKIIDGKKYRTNAKTGDILDKKI